MTSTLKIAWTFIRDHIWIIILAGIALLVFYTVPEFKELAYGAFRLLIGILIISVVLYTWTRETARDSIVSGTFVQKFKELAAQHHVFAVVLIIAIITWATVECLVHP